MIWIKFSESRSMRKSQEKSVCLIKMTKHTHTHTHVHTCKHVYVYV
jgi:hypothetical protein